MYTGTAVNYLKSEKDYYLPTFVKLWVESGSGYESAQNGKSDPDPDRHHKSTTPHRHKWSWVLNDQLYVFQSLMAYTCKCVVVSGSRSASKRCRSTIPELRFKWPVMCISESDGLCSISDMQPDDLKEYFECPVCFCIPRSGSRLPA